MATVDKDGHPVTRVIDIMLADDKTLYFITAKGKEFYRQLMEQKFVSVSRACGGEVFDLSVKPVQRESFAVGTQEGNEERKPGGDYITNACTGCKTGVKVCPQKCIETDKVPFKIRWGNCLHCGNCMAACRFGAVTGLWLSM